MEFEYQVPNATREDLEKVPPHLVAELIDGTLYVMPRPRPVHAAATAWIHSSIYGPYHRGERGPGGWWILVEPGVELPGAPEIVPDVAGWRRERLPSLPVDHAIDLAPDWVLEVQSPSTGQHDYEIKMPKYAQSGVEWLWMLSVRSRMLAVHRIDRGAFRLLDVFGGNDRVKVPPFEDVTLDLGALWMEVPLSLADSAPSWEQRQAEDLVETMRRERARR